CIALTVSLSASLKKLSCHSLVDAFSQLWRDIYGLECFGAFKEKQKLRSGILGFLQGLAESLLCV
ncbi:hypothetical protein, partial [Klebsiella pneumoniae]|uniref:hypothetical protein n=1 Tax=Klebsiella pneumoniae TaxID=573 RepID=UPI0030132BAD